MAERMAQVTLGLRICPSCKNQFEPRSIRQVYHDIPCRERARYKRAKEKGKCPSCSSPSLKKSVYCRRHLATTNKSSRNYRRRVRKYANENGMCIACVKEPKELGYCRCTRCRKKSVVYDRRHVQRRFDEFIDRQDRKGLITTDEAAEILGMSKNGVLANISLKNIELIERSYRRFWVKKSSVLEYRKKRKLRLRKAV